MGSRSTVWLVAGALVLGACASAPRPASSTSVHAGDALAAPSLRALPDLEGEDIDTPRAHQGLLLARETFDSALPETPVDRTFSSLQRWVDGPVASWVERRRSQIEATRARFALGGEPSAGEQVVSHAVVALLDEDTALCLGRLPSPSELDDEPEIAAMYRDMIRGQADIFVRSAVSELADCANQGYRGGDALRPWAELCHARFDRLQAQLESRATMRPLHAGAQAGRAQ